MSIIFSSALSLTLDAAAISALSNSSLITKHGVEEYSREMENCYLKDIADEMIPENIYSCYLHLYNSFHWQGSTVISFDKTCEYFDLNGHLPFLDKKIINILSVMPEKFGRGLDFNNTKFLLKEMLKKYVDYPNHLQDEGPHSYLYDINPNFNHSYEILYKSSFKNILRKKLKKGEFMKNLSKENFDMNYIKKIKINYLKNKKLSGQNLNNILALTLHELIYSDL